MRLEKKLIKCFSHNHTYITLITITITFLDTKHFASYAN